MAGPRYLDRVRETCAAPGTGTVALLGALASYQAFSAKLSNGDTCYVCIADQAGNNWEVGLATYSAGSLSRSAGNVLDGSGGSGVLVNFSSGTQDVFLVDPAALFPTGATQLVPASRQVIASTGLSGGGDLTGDVTVFLPNTGTAGSYNNVTTDTQGRVTSGSNVGYLTANQTITLSGDASGSGTTAIAVTLANSGVAAGTYGDASHYPVVTVDAKGRVTSVTAQAVTASVAIGSVIGGSTAGDVLYVDSANKLAEDANFTWDPTNGILRCTARVVAAPGVQANNAVNSCQASIGGSTGAGVFTDGIRTVSVCDGTNNLLYSPAHPGDWITVAGSTPSDVWPALDGLLAAVKGGGGSNPLTTKGDLFGFSTVAARVPVGSNGQVLTADSAQTLGLKWATPTTYSTFVAAGASHAGGLAPDPGSTSHSPPYALGDDAAFHKLIAAKGDLLVTNGTSLNQLAVGSNGQVLTADSTQTNGVKWATVPGGVTIGEGAFGSRPAAGTAGNLYFATDSDYLSRDNGSSWDVFGPIIPFTPPPAIGGFTWVNQGGATATQNSDGSIYITAPSAGETARLLVKSAPATPYKLTASFRFLIIAANNTGFGVCLRNSSSGKLILWQWTPASGGQLDGREMTNPTTFSADFGVTNMVQFTPMWLQIYDDGVNRNYNISLDGVTWYTVVSHANSTFLTADQVGFAVWTQNQPVPGVKMDHWACQ